MNIRRLILLMVVLALLVAAGRFLSAQENPVSRLEAAAVLVPADIPLDSLDQIELSVGKPEAPQLTIRKDSSGTWRIATAYNAPADKDRLAQLVKAFQGLSGEERARGGQWMKDFGLTDEAFHLCFKRKEKTAVDLLIGQGRKGRPVSFARRPNEQVLYALEEEVLQKAGFREYPTAQRLTPERWADLRLFPIQPADLTDLEIAEQTGKGWVVRAEYHRSQEQAVPDWSPLLGARGISLMGAPADSKSAPPARWRWKLAGRSGAQVELEEFPPERDASRTTVRFIPDGLMMTAHLDILNGLRERLLPNPAPAKKESGKKGPAKKGPAKKKPGR